MKETLEILKFVASLLLPILVSAALFLTAVLFLAWMTYGFFHALP